MAMAGQDWTLADLIYGGLGSLTFGSLIDTKDSVNHMPGRPHRIKRVLRCGFAHNHISVDGDINVISTDVRSATDRLAHVPGIVSMTLLPHVI